MSDIQLFQTRQSKGTHGILTSTSHIRSEWILILRYHNRLVVFRFVVLWPAIDLLVRLPLEFTRSTTSRKEFFHLGIKDCMSAPERKSELADN